FKASILPEEIVQQHLQHHGGYWKNIYFYSVIIRKLTRGHQKFQVKLEQIENTVIEILAEEEDSDNANSIIDLDTLESWKEQPITIDQCEVYLSYNQGCIVNILSIGQASPYEFLHQYLPINYIRQNVINSINIHGRETPNWIDVTFGEYIKMLHELEVPNLSNPLYSVYNFVNAFNSNLIEAVKPGSTLYSWLSQNTSQTTSNWTRMETLANSFTNIIIQLESCEDKEIEKTKKYVSDYNSGKYSSYFSKITLINNVCLIAASLRDQKTQCIIATTLTTTDSDEVKRIVKGCNRLSLVKFKRPKIFHNCSISKSQDTIFNSTNSNIRVLQVLLDNTLIILNKSLENNEKSDSLDYLSSDANEEILVSTLAAVSENKAVSSSKRKIKCGHSFNIQTATSNLASHLHTVHQVNKPDNLKEFKDIRAEVVAISCDLEFSHLAWSSELQQEQRTQRVRRKGDKENQDPLQEDSETERKKRKKKEEAKLEIARIYIIRESENNICCILNLIAEVLDAKVSDAEVLNAEVLDAKVLNAEVLDAEVLDAKVLDAKVLDAEVLDAKVLDAKVLVAEVLDTK
ncbi:38543_t:CDS:10, partial [Gigaspora margarita]